MYSIILVVQLLRIFDPRQSFRTQHKRQKSTHWDHKKHATMDWPMCT